MKMANGVITDVTTHDVRFTLEAGAGTAAVHSDPEYSYAVTRLHMQGQVEGVGLAFTLGLDNELVCTAGKFLARELVIHSLSRARFDNGRIRRFPWQMTEISV
jgi:L-fuconate dehydratase